MTWRLSQASSGLMENQCPTPSKSFPLYNYEFVFILYSVGTETEMRLGKLRGGGGGAEKVAV